MGAVNLGCGSTTAWLRTWDPGRCVVFAVAVSNGGWLSSSSWLSNGGWFDNGWWLGVWMNEVDDRLLIAYTSLLDIVASCSSWAVRVDSCSWSVHGKVRDGFTDWAIEGETTVIVACWAIIDDSWARSVPGKVMGEFIDWVVALETLEIEMTVAVEVMVGRFVKVRCFSVGCHVIV